MATSCRGPGFSSLPSRSSRYASSVAIQVAKTAAAMARATTESAGRLSDRWKCSARTSCARHPATQHVAGNVEIVAQQNREHGVLNPHFIEAAVVDLTPKIECREGSDHRLVDLFADGTGTQGGDVLVQPVVEIGKQNRGLRVEVQIYRPCRDPGGDTDVGDRRCVVALRLEQTDYLR